MARTLATCREPGEYLLLEDTTDLDYSGHGATAGLGRIGNGRGRGRGLRLHSTLAVRVETWDPEQPPEGVLIGLLGQQTICPSRPPPCWPSWPCGC